MSTVRAFQRERAQRKSRNARVDCWEGRLQAGASESQGPGKKSPPLSGLAQKAYSSTGFEYKRSKLGSSVCHVIFPVSSLLSLPACTARGRRSKQPPQRTTGMIGLKRFTNYHLYVQVAHRLVEVASRAAPPTFSLACELVTRWPCGHRCWGAGGRGRRLALRGCAAGEGDATAPSLW